jgi:hypothetical protein
MFGNMRVLWDAPSYEVARKRFNAAPAPRTQKQKEQWGRDARPLDNLRKWHYRIERARHDDSPEPAYFDVCLYHTTMARFYKPEPDGCRRVEYTFHGSVTSTQFMWRVVGINGRTLHYEHTDLGHPVDVPVSYKSLGTTLWFDAEDRLLTARSKHVQAYRSIASPELREWRRGMRKALESFLMLMEMRLPTIEFARGGPASRYGHPGKPFHIEYNKLRDVTLTPETVGSEMEDIAPALIEAYEAGVVSILAKQDWAAGYGNADLKPVTPAQARAAFMRRLDVTAPRRVPKTVRDPLPPFIKSLPRAWCE